MGDKAACADRIAHCRLCGRFFSIAAIAEDFLERVSANPGGPPAIGANYARTYAAEFYSLSKELVRASTSVDCNSSIASVAFDKAKPAYCYAYFSYPNGTKPQATCERKLPGSVVAFDGTGTPPPTPGFWGVFGYNTYLPPPGSKTATYVFYGNTGPETDIVKYPFVMCSKKPISP